MPIHESDTHSLIGMDHTELRDFFRSLNQPDYRAAQIFPWLYNRRVNSFQEMDNIPKSLRRQLEQAVRLYTLQEIAAAGAGSTRKVLFRIPSGEKVEAVLMREGPRTTVCLSTQVGCSLGCRFCATGAMGLQKNLSTGEMVEQFLLLQRQAATRITNVVFMGMGEPFLNYRRVIKAAGILNHGDGINLGARKITISTAGITAAIRRFTDEKQRYKLAISLNATTQKTRTEIMPIARSNPLDELMEAARDYTRRSRSRLTFEYVLMEGVNDSRADALRLAGLIGDLPCKVNLIPYNDIGAGFRRPAGERIEAFLEVLYSAPFTVTVRWSKGVSIKAGCGQLAAGPLRVAEENPV